MDDEAVRGRALGAVLDALAQVERLAAGLPGGDDPRVAAGLAVPRQVRGQDSAVGDDGVVRLRQGVARDRRIPVADPEMRHGRKDQEPQVDGYMQHVLRDPASALVRDRDPELFPCGGVPGLPAAGAVHQQPAGAQRAGPP